MKIHGLGTIVAIYDDDKCSNAAKRLINYKYDSAKKLALTEICIGKTKNNNNEDEFRMVIYREDLRQIINIVLKIRNNQDSGILTKNEKEFYDMVYISTDIKFRDNPIDSEGLPEFVEKLRNYFITTRPLPPQAKPDNLDEKLRYFNNFIIALCDPENGSPNNVPAEPHYHSRLNEVLRARNQWIENGTRPETLKNAAQKHLQCEEIKFSSICLCDINFENYETKYLEKVRMINVNMMKNYQTWVPLIIDRKIEIGRLTSLSLISCGITEVPGKIFDEYLEMPNKLEVLDLSKNNIKSIPKSISRCNALKYLILNENENLNNDGFPWGFLPFSIECLHLNKTAINVIPAQIERLYYSLRNLQVGDIALDTVPWNIMAPYLNELYIGNDINPEHFNGFNQSERVILHKTQNNLDCSLLPKNLMNLYMNVIPSFLEPNLLQKLTVLVINNTSMISINWENLPSKLCRIDFSYNSLQEVGNISHLRSLYNICLISNQISRIAEGIEEIPKLEKIWLNDNKLTCLPKAFEHCPKLFLIELSQNNFTWKNDIHETLWKRLPSNCSELNLDQNDIQELPCLITKFPLKRLQAKKCNLRKICPSIYSKMQSTQLKFDIRQNPAIKNLPFVPKAIYMPLKQEKGTKPLTIFELREQALSTQMILISDRNWNIGRFFTDKGKPKYKFDEISAGGDGGNLCSCCARCGSQNETTQISQMMVMDFSLIYDSINNSFENIFSYENLLEKSKVKCTCLHSCNEIPKKLPFILPTLCPGKWKTQIVTKLCSKCIGWFKEEADKVATEYLENKMNSMEVDDNDGDIVAGDIEIERKRQADDEKNETNNKKLKNQLQSETIIPQDYNEDVPMDQEIDASFYQDPQIHHNFQQPYYTYEKSCTANDVFFNDQFVPANNYYYNSQYDNNYEQDFAGNFCVAHSNTEFNSNFHMLSYQSEQQPQNCEQFMIYQPQEQQQPSSSSTSQWYNNEGASSSTFLEPMQPGPSTYNIPYFPQQNSGNNN